MADAYEKDCPGSTIDVDAHSSTSGLRELADRGARAERGSPPVVALSDGPKPERGYAKLVEYRIAMSVFNLVAHDSVGLRDLSLADVRRLYSGEIKNWRELGGPDLDVVLVGRSSSSGTRDILQRRLLNGEFEIRASSKDCGAKDDRKAPVIRCELDSTDQVLATVARTPGALGYSELRTPAPLKGLHRISLDGQEPSVEDLGRSTYPYREIEYAYTYGRTPANSLATSFLAFATRGGGQDIALTHGHLPCGSVQGLRVCGEK